MRSQAHPHLRLLIVFAAFGLGANWPQFRGPGGVGTAGDGNLPATWSAADNVAWKIELPGPGASSPVTFGDRIYLTCYTGYGLDEGDPGQMAELSRHVLCLDRASGKILWNRVVETDLPEQPFQGFLALHGYASSTPVTDGERVYVFFGKSGVFAFSVDGDELWQADVGGRTHNWGSGTSPVLYDNLVIVNASVESRELVALDKQTGQHVWTAPGIRSAWNTPLLVEVPGGASELVISMTGQIVGYDPRSGEKLWTCDGINDYVCPSVVAHEGVVYAIGARQNTALAVRAGGRGDVTGTHRLWTIGKGSNVSSPVYHEGHLYWMSESRGVAYCVKADTGQVVYEERVSPRPDRVYASPVVADGKLYYVSRQNGTFVFAARPSYEVLAHNELSPDHSVFNASPAVSDGQLLLRSNRFLYCIGAK